MHLPEAAHPRNNNKSKAKLIALIAALIAILSGIATAYAAYWYPPGFLNGLYWLKYEVSAMFIMTLSSWVAFIASVTAIIKRSTKRIFMWVIATLSLVSAIVYSAILAVCMYHEMISRK